MDTNTPGADSPAAAKNVILLVSDGAGSTTWDAASYYQHGGLGHEAYDDFAVKRYMTTLSADSLDAIGEYDPAKAWDAAASTGAYNGNVTDYPNYYDALEYLRDTPTDSAAAGTALASGTKVPNGMLNVDADGNELVNLGDLAVESGRELGIVTSVQWSHATPAAFGAHNADRNDYAGVAQEMIDTGKASVIMGAGHPFYDGNGELRAPEGEDDFQYIGGVEGYMDLVSGNTDYTFFDSREAFEALADGTWEVAPGEKVLGTAQVGSTLQFDRDGVAMDPLNDNVPDLATMTKGALNVLGDDEDGFFLAVEGGAVDWAAHANNLPRMIQEQRDFNDTVEAVTEWVEENSSWEETMVVVTTDHANGLLLGPDSDEDAFETPLNQGQGALPLVRWHSDNHTNELVPVWANGAGSDKIAGAATRQDPGLAAFGAEGEEQFYLDNTDIFHAMASAMGVDGEAVDGPVAEAAPEATDWESLMASLQPAAADEPLV
ncbi:alkaline phosphatase [Marinivivus vitaminiproducens]|uniref:alkaline phosphatase n=1 Tax=Marinivivus vitaminiproducens TaxID=3035935 RepID=UPI00279DF64A|nr:alkaline phosphatase [Geminicoccaceae bacterium SCSIO 64248]